MPAVQPAHSQAPVGRLCQCPQAHSGGEPPGAGLRALATLLIGRPPPQSPCSAPELTHQDLASEGLAGRATSS